MNNDKQKLNQDEIYQRFYLQINSASLVFKHFRHLSNESHS